jgi:acetyl-CoA acyltransferase
MPDALIVDAVRSPIGRKNGTLASVRADELAGQVLNGLVDRVDIEPAEIEDVQMGCVSQVGEQALNVGRVALLVAGWPETVCAATTDRQCGSSMQAAFNAAAAIQAGHLDVVVAAGVESMSRVPMGSNLGPDGFAGFSEKLFERWEIVPQGISAEVLADEWNLSREALDAYSYESHRRAITAIDEGRFEKEIVPIEVSSTDSELPDREPVPVGEAGLRPARAHTAVGTAASVKEGVHGGTMGSPMLKPHVGTLFAVDETPRRDTSLEKLADLAPAFKADGVVTAGSSSQICDGAAAMLVVSEDAASKLKLEPRGRFVSFGLAGVDPYRMLHGNPQACERALAKAGLAWDDIEVIEVNEAFASVVLQFLADTRLEERWQARDVNPNGGGISLGHPLGATGARMTATLLSELERRDARYGIATMCIGQGQAIAGIIERV